MFVLKSRQCFEGKKVYITLNKLQSAYVASEIKQQETLHMKENH